MNDLTKTNDSPGTLSRSSTVSELDSMLEYELGGLDESVAVVALRRFSFDSNSSTVSLDERVTTDLPEHLEMAPSFKQREILDAAVEKFHMQVSGLITREDLTEYMRDIPEETLEIVVDQALRIIDNRMTSQDIKETLGFMNQISGDKKTFVDQALRLIHDRTSLNDKKGIFALLAQIPGDKKTFVDQALRLIDDTTPRDDKRTILRLMVSVQKLETFVDQVFRLNPGADIQYKREQFMSLVQISSSGEEVKKILDLVERLRNQFGLGGVCGLNGEIQRDPGIRLNDVIQLSEKINQKKRELSRSNPNRLDSEILDRAIQLVEVQEGTRIRAIVGERDRIHRESQERLERERAREHGELLARLNVFIESGALANVFPDGEDPEQFMIHVKNISDTPIESLLSFSQKYADLGALPKIKYSTEAEKLGDLGDDVTGITRDFITRLLTSLTNKSELPTTEDEEGLLLRLEEKSGKLDLKTQIDSYKAIGMILAIALQDVQLIKTGSQFHFSLFQMIHALTQEQIARIPDDVSLENLPKDIYQELLAVHLKSRFGAMFNSEEVDKDIFRFMQRDPAEWTRQYFCIETKDDVDEFLKEHKVDEILLATLVIAKSMSKYLQLGKRWDEVKGNKPEDLRDRIEGVLSKSELLSFLTFSDQTHKEYLEKWIEKATTEKLERFVFAIFGSSRLPSDREKKFEIMSETIGNQALSQGEPDAKKHWPRFCSCYRQMFTVPYNTLEGFAKNLEASINNAWEATGMGNV